MQHSKSNITGIELNKVLSSSRKKYHCLSTNRSAKVGRMADRARISYLERWSSRRQVQRSVPTPGPSRKQLLCNASSNTILQLQNKMALFVIKTDVSKFADLIDTWKVFVSLYEKKSINFLHKMWHVYLQNYLKNICICLQNVCLRIYIACKNSTVFLQI